MQRLNHKHSDILGS